MTAEDELRALRASQDPIHYGIHQGAVAVYRGRECIGSTGDKAEAANLALAMLLGPQMVGGVLIEDQRTRYGIARAALDVALA